MAALVDIALANTVGVFVGRFNELNQRMTSLTTEDGQLSVANTNITGDTLLISANTNISGILKVNGSDPEDNALAFSIALG